MPRWAQWLGELLPITHFIRIIRGALLKDQALGDMRPDILALAVFLVAASAVTMARSRTTLD
jgi:ABC-2 type transport system permease protein